MDGIETDQFVDEQRDMRELFHGAIKIQQDLILEAQRRIDHYHWALSEMASQQRDNIEIVEPADPKMLEICKAIVQDVA